MACNDVEVIWATFMTFLIGAFLSFCCLGAQVPIHFHTMKKSMRITFHLIDAWATFTVLFCHFEDQHSPFTFMIYKRLGSAFINIFLLCSIQESHAGEEGWHHFHFRRYSYTSLLSFLPFLYIFLLLLALFLVPPGLHHRAHLEHALCTHGFAL